jgi:hypothetical protein
MLARMSIVSPPVYTLPGIPLGTAIHIYPVWYAG